MNFEIVFGSSVRAIKKTRRSSRVSKTDAQQEIAEGFERLLDETCPLSLSPADLRTQIADGRDGVRSCSLPRARNARLGEHR